MTYLFVIHVGRNGDHKSLRNDAHCHLPAVPRKRDWESTDITIRFGKGTKPDAGGDSISRDPAPKMSGARQSKRLRQVKQDGERRKVTISKSTTVKDIKIMVRRFLHLTTVVSMEYSCRRYSIFRPYVNASFILDKNWRTTQRRQHH